MLWTCTITAEQLDSLKASVPGHIDKQREKTAKFPETTTLPVEDHPAYQTAMTHHDTVEAYLLNQWLDSVAHDGTTATATIDWSNAPVEDLDEWTWGHRVEWAAGALRDIPLNGMSNNLRDPDAFEAAHTLLEAVDDSDYTPGSTP
jgi:hypothetical protein